MNDDLTGFSYQATDGEMHGHIFTVTGRTTQADIDSLNIIGYRWPLKRDFQNRPDAWNVRLDDGPFVSFNEEGSRLREMRDCFAAGRRSAGVAPIGGYSCQ